MATAANILPRELAKIKKRRVQTKINIKLKEQQERDKRNDFYNYWSLVKIQTTCSKTSGKLFS